MTQAEADLDGTQVPKPSRGKGLIAGGILGITLGVGGFYAARSGMIPLGETQADDSSTPEMSALSDIAFIPMDPILISLGAGGRTLRFQGQVEVGRSHLDDVKMLMPRIVDVLNAYLRAVEPAELEDPGGLTRLRAQMLRRAQVVTGEGRVRDLLIMEFVFS